MANTVVVEELVKVYPGGTRAVAGIDFAVGEGEFFGFLGPNGAGKTTTLKILSTLLRKTSGRVEVGGHDADRDPAAVRRSIGFAMQEVGLDDLATGRDFLELQGVLYGLPMKSSRDRAAELLELVGLSPVAERKVGTYSGGMRRRIDLIGAMMHSPPLLFLDEPTTGLDPQSRLAIWDHLRQLNQQGVTIFLTTQMMDEADRLCGRVAIVDSGQIVAEGAPKALKAEIGGDLVEITVGSEEGAGEDAERAARLFDGRADVKDVSFSGNAVLVTTANGSAAVAEFARLLEQNDIRVANLSVASPTLDDVFLQHTGRTIRAESADGNESDQVARQWLGVGRR